MAIVHAPFDERQLASLRGYQSAFYVHPFTCCGIPQVPEADGMHCHQCGTVQDWVHNFMADGSYKRMEPTWLEAIGE